MNKKYTLGILGIIVVLAFLYFVWTLVNIGVSSDVSDVLPNATTTDSHSIATTSPVSSVSAVPVISKTVPAPKLYEAGKIPAVFTPEQADIVRQEIVRINTLLKKDSSDLQAWYQLATYRKMIDDFDGAIVIWQYLIKVDPSSVVPISNIASVMAYDQRKFSEAVAYYEMAVAKAGTQGNVYLDTAHFYHELRKDDTRAKAVLNLGIKNAVDVAPLQSYLSEISH